ncbi:Transposase protein [Popillia japonica]|uniref:Transposase protein n=1 Tax=Popillia japonica TaxID=7064 RepID=A0AAW1ITI1_POPJA
MQFFHSKRSKWTKSEKQLALSLFYKSPSTYSFMIKKLRVSLPSVRTIQSWLQVLNLKTGMKTTLTNKLELKAKSMTEREKMCVVMFDEIILKKELQYNKYQDVVEGYQDLANFGKQVKLANTALVFLVRGLLHNWKIPLAYYRILQLYFLCLDFFIIGKFH